MAEAFAVDDRVYTRQLGPGDPAIIVAVDEPREEDYVGEVEEWEIEEDTLYLVRYDGDGIEEWLFAADLIHREE